MEAALASGDPVSRIIGDLRRAPAALYPSPPSSLGRAPYRASFLFREPLWRSCCCGGALTDFCVLFCAGFMEFYSSSELKCFSRVHSLRFNQLRWALLQGLLAPLEPASASAKRR